jgi:hypothetical protein
MTAHTKPIGCTFRHLTASIAEHAQTKQMRSRHSRRHLRLSNATGAHRLEFDLAMRALIFGILIDPPLRAAIGQ